MSERADVSLDSIIAPAPNASRIEANEPVADGPGLLVSAHGEVVMGSPVDFERAG